MLGEGGKPAIMQKNFRIIAEQEEIIDSYNKAEQASKLLGKYCKGFIINEFQVFAAAKIISD